MAKVHRMYKHAWQRTPQELTERDYQAMCNFATLGYSFESIARQFHCSLAHVQRVIPYAGVFYGFIVDRKYLQQEEQEIPHHWTVKELRQDFAMVATGGLGSRDQEPGIPGGVDVLDWYRALQKVEGGRDPEKQTKKEAKTDYYQDVLYQIYRTSGYGLEESIHVAYTPQGKEIMHYLAKSTLPEDQSTAV